MSDEVESSSFSDVFRTCCESETSLKATVMMPKDNEIIRLKVHWKFIMAVVGADGAIMEENKHDGSDHKANSAQSNAT
jgi:hypothetical protein